MRVAVLANATPEQAELAAHEVERWLLAADSPSACERAAARERTSSGGTQVAHVSGSDGRVLVGVELGPTAKDRAFGELLAAALQGPEGMISKELGADRLALGSTAELVGARSSAMLVIDVSCAPGKAEAVQHEQREAERADPRVRLAELWLGVADARAAGDPAPDRLRAWLRDALAEPKIVVVTGTPAPSP